MPRSLTSHLKPGIGPRLRQSREAAGLSQRQLSFEGCTAAYISRIEAGVRNPSLQMINELAHRLNVDAHWLATGEERSEATEQSLREQLLMARARIRELEGRLDQISSLSAPT